MRGELVDNQGKGLAGWSWPPIHPEGRKFGLLTGFASAAAAFLAWETIAWPLAFLTIGVLAFFRDPPRSVPQDPRAILAPADGLVTLITRTAPPPELCSAAEGLPALGEALITRVSIFMSVFDVHINRAPIAGTVRRIAYIPGKFVNADLDKASEDNERQHILIEGNGGLLVGLTQIAGLVARRIVPFVKPGDTLAAGQRVGLIRFGSRVDVYLPQGTEPRVLLGQKTVAGETVIAVVGEAPVIAGAIQ
jgi:phosphatidylserine decarboxylase